MVNSPVDFSSCELGMGQNFPLNYFRKSNRVRFIVSQTKYLHDSVKLSSLTKQIFTKVMLTSLLCDDKLTFCFESKDNNIQINHLVINKTMDDESELTSHLLNWNLDSRYYVLIEFDSKGEKYPIGKYHR